MTESAATLLQAVTDLARLAGDAALEHYKPGIASHLKADGSPVTLADRAAERLAREWLRSRFPSDGILGEEFGEEPGNGSRRWILDPIDGTKSFVRHVPLWGTLIAVEERGEVIAGAAYFPVVGELVAAARGEGCWLNGVRSAVSSVQSLSEATVLTTDDRFLANPARRGAWQVLASRASVARTWGDCYGYLMVATGRAEVMLDDIASPWDAAAVLPLVTEAGGVFTDFGGRTTAAGGCIIATNGALAAEVRAIMNDR